MDANRLKGMVFVLALALATPAAAQVSNSSAALSTCIKDAIKQLIIYNSLVSQRDIYSSGRRLISNEVIFDGRVLGKKARYQCLYTYGTGRTVIRPYRETPTPLPGPVPSVTLAQVEKACVRTAQDANLSVDRVMSSSTETNSRKQIIAYTLKMRVYNKGKPSMADCRYDVMTGKAKLTKL
jgi:hypothetical protein